MKEKEVKDKTVKKVVCPMPFNGKMIEGKCGGLRQNHGLYTQCETDVKDEEFCKKCGVECIYGTVKQRLEVGLMDFRDPKGKSPLAYVKVMKKLNLSKEDVLREALIKNMEIDEIHFEEEKDYSQQ